ncbi:MAG TPA: PHP domain-containing protein [Bacillus sp. (in: firmicutes)]|nr:PHP domain-containing protein [Bacillus sp. (in: firmicutes)]
MKIRVELHTHTRYSQDSLLNKWFYLLMLKMKKINVIGITDHNEINGALEFKKFLERFDIKVIVGEEIFSSKGEIIGLFLTKKIDEGKSPRETMKEIKKQGGLVYIPHPYDEKRYKTVLPEEEIEKNLDLIDIIEMHNGRNIKQCFSDYQLNIANKFNKTKSVGSDAHTFFELGRNYNIIESFSNQKEFLTNLNNSSFVKKDCIKLAHDVTKIVKIIKLFRKGKINEIYRIINKRYRRSERQVSPENRTRF